MRLRNQILALAIGPLVLAIIIITALITWQSMTLARTSIDAFERNMLAAKEAELLNLTNLALSAIRSVYDKAGPGDDAAKEEVKRILMDLDYGTDGYFFVYDYDGLNVVHPRQNFRPGNNWLDLYDPDGNRVIYDLILKAKEGGGLVQYKWEKPSTRKTADKLSFAAGLDKWRWMIGTGVYLDDVFAATAAAKEELRHSITWNFLIVALFAVPAVLLVFATCMLLNLRQQRMADGRLKELMQRVIDTQEEERLRIARELHDGISQNLVGVRFAIDLARRKVTPDNVGAVEAIGKGAAALTEAIKEVRRISHDLRPRVLDDLGLTAALEALISSFSERTGIAATLESVAFKHMLVPEARVALYRVAQEALTNIERHSNATRVTIRFSSRDERVQMIVSDNGRGFPATREESEMATYKGLGLRNMQERMTHFGGRLDVESSAKGTVLRAVLPMTAMKDRGHRVQEAAE
ncbi:two-component system sensor histidine kinase MctS [Agrobacterium tumefaciens]|uniref:cache domain-containing protein n=2 Tax=Agrobacterium TaxID=357 RepID=UPI0015723DB8|nr:cache domain-containing protein [Agrobacterium tumefaciens]MEA1844670.1 cache domain-containing protein [Agrobacterium tumefaciens]NTA45292.1 histidine kinase [Agrobacterium tumefaciens]UXT84735.1 histidine kinase [Agrobacterium tumefaciens]WCK21889.1 cache domain-containing protein [Agrobacterium tumefaciens]WIE35746.1 cache domain-containing protein [Agrobacterium tumefaciens]